MLRHLLKTFVLAIFLSSILSSCSDKKDALAGVTQAEETPDYDSMPVVAQKAYQKGLAVGQRISEMKAGSREREYALIEVHGMVSALERNGFRQSAIDFSKGVRAALNSTEI